MPLHWRREASTLATDPQTTKLHAKSMRVAWVSSDVYIPANMRICIKAQVFLWPTHAKMMARSSSAS